jgi:ribosomal protein S18 acetylase RimI-like enzyme
VAFPSIQEACGLTPEQLDALADLERRVLAHDGGRLKLEWGVLRQRPADEANDLLTWDGGTLAGFCGIYAFGKEPELSIVVDPAYRRRGVGSALLDRSLRLVARRGHPSVLLVTPRATDSGRRFAQARGATFDHAEHHMELDGPPTGPPAPRPSTDDLVVRPAVDADRAAVVSILEDAFGNGAASFAGTEPNDLALVVERNSAVVGTLRLSWEGHVAGVYGLAVRAGLRGQGIGRAVLYQVCLEARRRGATTVTLEVEVGNDRALGLYTSAGFRARTTEDYFSLAV